jgi:uncharacterized integral membrane protein
MMAHMRREDDRRPEDDERVAEARRAVEGRRRSTIAKVVIALALTVLFLVFVIQNSKEVDVNFVFVDAQIPLVWVFLGCAAIGAIIASLLGRPRRRATKQLIRELERQREERGRS